MDIENLFDNYQQLKLHYQNIYQRQIYGQLTSGFRIIGIVGGRGVGKTTYLFNLLAKKFPHSEQGLYVSADNIFFRNGTLFELAKKFVDEYNGKLLCIDEIHRYPNWAQELKNIYDNFFDLKIVFSGSSSLNLIEQKYDLSRRATLKNLPGFSFREYLEFKKGKKLPKLSLQEITRRSKKSEVIYKIPRLPGHFKDYLQVGYYPIFTDFENKTDLWEALNGVIDKVVNIDIASYYSLKTETLPILKKILYFLLTIPPGAISVNKIANSLKKTNPDTARYLEMLRGSGLVRYLLNDKTGHLLLRHTEKIYLNDPNLVYALSYWSGKTVEIGMIRELFFLSQVSVSGYKIFFKKEQGDFVVKTKKNNCQKYIFEVGGKNKKNKQIQGLKNSFIVQDDILIGNKKRIPLYLFGFLY